MFYEQENRILSRGNIILGFELLNDATLIRFISSESKLFLEFFESIFFQTMFMSKGDFVVDLLTNDIIYWDMFRGRFEHQFTSKKLKKKRDSLCDSPKYTVDMHTSNTHILA